MSTLQRLRSGDTFEIFAIRGDDSNKNESGWKVQVVPDKQPFLQIYGDLDNRGMGMYDVLNGIGAHKLVIESPKHSEQIYDMDLDQIQNVLFAYRERFLDLKHDTRFSVCAAAQKLRRRPGRIEEPLAFTHHCNSNHSGARVKYELMNTREHYEYKERCLFCDIINQELADDERIILQNDQFVALTPFASRAPFEISILPKQRILREEKI